MVKKRILVVQGTKGKILEDIKRLFESKETLKEALPSKVVPQFPFEPVKKKNRKERRRKK